MHATPVSAMQARLFFTRVQCLRRGGRAEYSAQGKNVCGASVDAPASPGMTLVLKVLGQ
jgi:hypothetical protein